ncbi:MAG: P-type DNA transfer protein VirB5 [Burkholderiales bacterium]|nr:P-type DNA transfer protein VirB5 [Burkholderiales bacterium]
MEKPFRLAALALVTGLSIPGVHAQGIPVIDVANLVQTIQQVMNDITEIENQVEQIRQMQNQVTGMTGSRNLGNVFNSATLKNYVPANAFTVVNAVDSGGYGGLTTTGKSLRDVGMVYNCLDRTGAARTNCQATLAQPYQQKALLQDAMQAASGRLGQISSLMSQINSTDDQKAVLEIQARIGAENAMLQHEMSQVHMLTGMADSEERIARSRERERQYEMLTRTGKISDYLR